MVKIDYLNYCAESSKSFAHLTVTGNVDCCLEKVLCCESASEGFVHKDEW